MGQPVIQLYDLEGLGLIIECPSGVLYTNQAGGVFCMQPIAEGVLVPLGSECDMENKFDSFFAERPIRLQPDDADALDLLLRTRDASNRTPPTFFLEVDRSRLADSVEAWLHVTIVTCPDEHVVAYSSGPHGISDVTTLSGRAWSPDDQPELGEKAMFYPFSGFARRSAILTWANSD